MVLAVGREIVVYPELLQVVQECGLFRGVEAAKRELYWASILREELGRTGGASLQLPPDGHDAGFDSIKAGFNLSRTVASSPQRKGDTVPCGGGGRYRATTALIFPPKPDRVQLAKASRPPGLKTRAISETTAVGSGENMIPNIETSTSKLPSG